MFSGVNSSPMMSSECFLYDFMNDENLIKWRDMFVPALERILKQVHPSLTATKESIEKVEILIIQVLAVLLCGAQPPHSINDISDRVHKKLPDPINTWAVGDANNAIDRLKKDKKGGAINLLMPADKLHQMLVKEVFCHKIDYQITVFITAVLEYVAADILKLIGNYVKNIRHPEITLPDVDVALCADKVLMNMLFDDDDDHVTIHVPVANEKSLSSQSYEEIVKDLILDENQYLRELNMIIKVFRDSIDKIASIKDMNMEEIFDSVSDMHELTLNLISSLEDTLEATKEGEAVLIGSCFEDFMEGMEFNVYQKYSFLILDSNVHVRWVDECSRLPLHKLTRRGLGECIKYVLPNLLLDPVYHFIYYCDILKILMSKSKDEDDKELLNQSLNSLSIIRTDMDRKLACKAHFKKGRRSNEKLEDIQRSIDGWDGKSINQICNDYITEGFLHKVSGKRLSDRNVFLFDGILVLTKKINPARRSVTYSSSQSSFDYKLKEKFFVRKIEVIDKEDTEDLKNTFEIVSTHQKQQSHMTLLAKTHEEKIHWLSAFFYLLNKSMLERLLDSKLKEEEKRQPLKLPSPDQYRFAIEDSEDNIVFEDNGGGNNTSSNDIPVIKGGIIIKLVERLTFHSYFDPKFTKTFLTTYRTFCKPKELLSLLIERFNIPEPNGSNVERDSMKKFRNSFIKPISFRVLNVLRQWVDHHWYDFESDKALYDQLVQFLEESVKGKVLKKWVETINKVLARKLNTSMERSKQITFVSTPPPIEWHISRNPAEFDIMNLHPIEIARQVTLLEFEIFKTIKSSEMVGAVWTKKDKQVTSPNLLKMIHHTTKFTFWLEKCIMETDNFEERVAVMNRVLEILVVFQELNNFNGVIEVHSALSSASVHRLEHTFEEVEKKSPKSMKALEEAKELNDDHFRRYIEKLRSINPPCIPFLGMYLTNILHLEEGNPDFLTNRPQGFINFSKRRKVAEITAEIQQYQDQPYCLNGEPQIRAFIENLKPLGDMSEKEFVDYLYERSLYIEPRNGKPIKLEKRRDYSLKSPGTKPTSSLSSSSSSLHYRGNLPLLASHKNPSHHSHHHPRYSHASSVTNQGVSLDESLEGDSPTDSGSPISCSTHYSSGEDVGETKDAVDVRSLVVLSNAFLCQSIDSLHTNNNSLSGSSRTLCSSDTVVHSPHMISRSPTSDGRSPNEASSSSPPPLPPRHNHQMRRHNHSQSPSQLPRSGFSNSSTTRFPFPPRKNCLEYPPPALPPRENPSRLPPPVPPRRSEHFLPQFQHHHCGSPLPGDVTNFYCEFNRPPTTPAPTNGCRDATVEDEEAVPAIPPKNYRSYSGVS